MKKMTENNYSTEKESSLENDLEELFRDNSEVIALKNNLPSMSKDNMKKIADGFRMEIAQLSNNINELKKKREEYNSEAKHYRTMRNNVSDEKFVLIEKLTEQAKKERELREEYNEHIRTNKNRREQLKAEVRSAWEKVKDLRERYFRMKEEVGVMPDELTNEIRRLEWEQQTSSLSPDEDAEFTKKISELYEKAYAAHLIGFSSDELDHAIQTAKALSEEHDKAHQNVLLYATKGQEHHEKMLKLYEEINKMRSGGNTLHDRYLEARQAADITHQKIVELYEKIKLKQYLMDIIDDEQNKRRYEQSVKLREEKVKETEQKKSSSKRLTLDELRLLMDDQEEEENQTKKTT